MSSRKASCDPCCQGKLACGHEQPKCGRCKLRNLTDSCVYRSTPFKRTKPQKRRSTTSGSTPTSPITQPASRPSESQSPAASHHNNHYPNPGYLGASSHANIFNHILSAQGSDLKSPLQTAVPPIPSPMACHSPEDHHLTNRGALLIQQLFTSYDLNSLISLVKFWRAKNVNLAAAGPFVDVCADASNFASLSKFETQDWHLKLAARLFHNTNISLEFDDASTINTFSSQLLGVNTRWETLGVFLAAAIGAARDVPFFPPLYTTFIQNQELRRLLTKLFDCAVDICISLDQLNDLQLVLQYQNSIVHAYVDGDQSYRYWRKLGDIIASISALGYNENLETKTRCPRFLTEIRKTVFARIYSADKNLSIFLGRPPRMSKRFCCFQIPRCSSIDGGLAEDSEWLPDAVMNYAAETRWAAQCASIKEEIVEMIFDRNRISWDDRARITGPLRARADANWAALPDHFRYKGNLKQPTYTPFKRDFLLATRLNHLHIHFLIRRFLLPRLTEPDAAVIEIAEEILHLVAEAVLLREELVNSGTGLDWKIAYYGVPSAGILLLAILRQQRDSTCPRASTDTVLTDLTVLAAEVNQGTVVRPEDPNFALLSESMQTIQRFLAQIHGQEKTSGGMLEQYAGHDTEWLMHWDQDPKDFDIDFWQGLWDHSLVNGEVQGGG